MKVRTQKTLAEVSKCHSSVLFDIAHEGQNLY